EESKSHRSRFVFQPTKISTNNQLGFLHVMRVSHLHLFILKAILMAESANQHIVVVSRKPISWPSGQSSEQLRMVQVELVVQNLAQTWVGGVDVSAVVR